MQVSTELHAAPMWKHSSDRDSEAWRDWGLFDGKGKSRGSGNAQVGNLIELFQH